MYTMGDIRVRGGENPGYEISIFSKTVKEKCNAFS